MKELFAIRVFGGCIARYRAVLLNIIFLYTHLGKLFAYSQNIVYTQKVREDEGGAYYVSVNGLLNKYPQERGSLQIFFETAPEKRNRMMQIIFQELENLAKQGPQAEDLQKVKEFKLKKFDENQKENGYWLGCIDELLFTGVNVADDYKATLESITADDIRSFMSDWMKQGNEIEVSMISEGQENK